MARGLGLPIRCSALALITATVLVACGADSETEGGNLKITQVFMPAEPIGIEGSAAALTLSQAGEQVARVRTDISEVSKPEVLFDKRLNAGTYEINVAHHACYGPGACFIDEAGNSFLMRCVGEVEIRDGETSEMTVRVSSDSRTEKPPTCSIAES